MFRKFNRPTEFRNSAHTGCLDQQESQQETAESRHDVTGSSHQSFPLAGTISSTESPSRKRTALTLILHRYFSQPVFVCWRYWLDFLTSTS